MNLEKQVYHYTMQKIHKACDKNITFFETLNTTKCPENESLYYSGILLCPTRGSIIAESGRSMVEMLGTLAIIGILFFFLPHACITGPRIIYNNIIFGGKCRFAIIQRFGLHSIIFGAVQRIIPKVHVLRIHPRFHDRFLFHINK